KLAMVKIDQQLDEDCHQLLQIHDSILLECPKAKANKVAKQVEKIMETVYKLPVKLEVDVHTGLNWGEL
ncbi:hypothetical protein HY441_01615, partial [Candidatus Microgenomates bacterium]|nr:hypothetical protein [Candidatus Microgenomates bacterium]